MDTRKKVERCIALAFVSVLVVGLFCSADIVMFRVSCQQLPGVLSIEPREVRVNVSEVFSVNVDIADVIEVYEVEFRLSWNPSVLNFTEFEEGSFLSNQGQTVFLKEVFEENGYMYIGGTLIGNVSRATGGGTLVSIQFTAFAPGESALDISESPFEEIDGNVIASGVSLEQATVHNVELLVAASASPTVWTVNPLGPPTYDFATIQGAINSPLVFDGDVLHVFAANYVENVNVWKSLTIIGENRSTTFVTAATARVSTSTLSIRAPNVKILELTIQLGYAGVRAFFWNDATIKDCRVVNNTVGFVAWHSDSNDVKANNVSGNKCGILLWRSNVDLILGNDITNNSAVGIQVLHGSDGNNIYWNDFIQLGGVPNALAAWTTANTWDVMGKGNYWNKDVFGQGPYMNPTNVDNNPLTAPWNPMLGDVNLDGKVNIVDITICAMAFGTHFSDLRWNPQADVNRDGLVNILDIALAAKNFGKTDP